MRIYVVLLQRDEISKKALKKQQKEAEKAAKKAERKAQIVSYCILLLKKVNRTYPLLCFTTYNINYYL